MQVMTLTKLMDFILQKVVKTYVRHILNVNFGPGIKTTIIVNDIQEILLALVERIVCVDLELVQVKY